MSFLMHFQAGLNIPRRKVFKKKKKNSILSNYPIFFFQGLTWTTHIFLFGLSELFHLQKVGLLLAVAL